MAISEGIGPHEGRELELMLKGEKPCAYFHDYIPASGMISEDIIPEAAFAPYVTVGQFFRLSSELKDNTFNRTVRYVCFTQPGQEWRAEFFRWLSENLNAGKKIRRWW